MPELPEVETVVRGLRNNIVGKKIDFAEISGKNLRLPYPENLLEYIADSKISAVNRRSKYVLIEFENRSVLLVIHLGMSGKITFSDESYYEKAKHDHLIIHFTDEQIMVFNDPRRFGLLKLVDKNQINEDKLFHHLGAEPFSEDFTAEYLSKKFSNKTVSIKQALMDSKNLVGVGNIYASESLFRSGINPVKPAGKITKNKLNILRDNIIDVLQEAIESGGSTLRDFVRSDGESGYFQHNFRVYDKQNQPCVNCSTAIEKIVQQGRSTYYCPKCQK